MRKAVDPEFPQSKELAILEVGSGPVGIVSFLDGKRRVAVDPLCDYYSTESSLIAHRDPGVTYVNASGEELAFDAESFDLVILDNVIDHVRNHHRVMSRIHDLLMPKGILYFTVNLHPLWGSLIHRLLAVTAVDPGHPHTFTLEQVRKFLTEHNFESCHEEWEDYKERCECDRRSGSLKARIKGWTGLSAFLYTSVALRK
ncbi:MAG: methyltransferase domain-containing protein [Acidobacteriota bacterium]|nr:MAG: methyltransferase domain-containing protein [Acidobacteriota bacterium]